MSRTCFLNVGIGPWYTSGSDRLAASLIAHGFPGDQLIWKDQWPGALTLDRSNIYNCKADAFQHALDAGYTTIIWGDSSVYARKNIQPFIDAVNERGFWIGRSGYNCAQVCTDAQLQYFGVSRDWAERVPDSATGLFGVNMDNPQARAFILAWIKAAKEGMFAGSRSHNRQSRDPRFKFCRQDQSCASLVLGTHGLTPHHFLEFARFAWDTADTVFHCEGM